MVARKTSIPYPTSPPPPPPPPEPSTQQSHHHVDSADVPPVPRSVVRSNAQSTFEEMGNPWQDHYRPTADNRSNIPDLLRPGPNKAPAQPSSTPQTIPDALRPGRSGEATPRSSLDSDRSPEREWWDDEDAEVVEDPRDWGRDQEDQHRTSRRLPNQLHVVNDTPSAPAFSVVKRKPLPRGHSSQDELVSQSTGNTELASNNPFRRPSETHLHIPTDSPDWGAEDKMSPREHHPHPLRSAPSTDRLGNLALSDDPEEKIAIPQAPAGPPPPPPQQAPPPIPQLQAPLVPSQHLEDQTANPWSTQNKVTPVPSPISFNPMDQHDTVSTDDLLDRGEHRGSVSLGDELKALPNAVPSPQPLAATEVSLLEDDEPAPPKPPRPIRQESNEVYTPPFGPPPSHIPPPKPPRPAIATSEADLARMKEQRNETYQIKHFNWHDLRTNKIRRSSMLTQNKNGPCPLLALVNALILGATEDMQAALDDALRSREQVSLGLIIETLMDELITRASTVAGLQLPEIDELNRFLMRLRTGMNANPRFVPPRAQAPNLMDGDTPTTPTHAQSTTSAGTFENTEDIKLYGSFGVKLLHGWLPRREDEAAKAFVRSAQTYEDAQAVQFGEEELEYKISGGGLTEQEQQLWHDITSIKQFFQAYPTQLTPYGLSTVQQTLRPGEFAILFRNDHFSTIYKHPRDQRLYTLITDAGYADRDEIIWETLEDINGARSEFFSGDFHSVSHGDTRHATPHRQTDAANPERAQNNRSHLTVEDAHRAEPTITPQEQQEQHDADFAMALQLQEEEEQRLRQARGRGGGSGVRASPPIQRPQGRRPGQGNIPIPLRSNPGGEVRPVVPPRNSNVQNRNHGVNRPADSEDADAPPAYEEASRLPSYNPPLGSPLHPGSSTDLPLRGAGTSTSNIHAQGQTSGVTTGGWNSRPSQQRRRTSAYGENSEAWRGNSPDYSTGAFGPGYAYMGPGADQRRRAGDRRQEMERDCTVM